MKAAAIRSPTVMEADEDSNEADDGEEFFTASEGEEEDVGKSKGQFQSSTKLLLDFSISEVCVIWHDMIRSFTNRFEGGCLGIFLICVFLWLVWLAWNISCVCVM